MNDGEPVPAGVDDPSGEPAATPARIYDFLLGGHHNFPADRAAAEATLALNPRARDLALANRAFLARAVTALVEEGLRQFLDLGSGIPTVGNVHEIAQQAAPDTRVMYVDIDPIAVVESQQLLTGSRTVAAVRADLLNPRDLLDRPELRAVLDLDKPTAVLAVSVLHFCPDSVHDALANLRSAVSPGSYLVLSHVIPDESIAHFAQAGMESYRRATGTTVHRRSREEIMRLFGEFELVAPGLVPVDQWRHPEHSADPALEWFLAGVARKP